GWLGRRLLDLLLERGQRSLRNAAAPVVVDDPVPEHPVEPGGGALLRLQWQPVHAAGERLLEEVLRGLAMAHPSLEEGKERGPVLGHGREELVAGWRRHGANLATTANASMHGAGRGEQPALHRDSPALDRGRQRSALPPIERRER